MSMPMMMTSLLMIVSDVHDDDGDDVHVGDDYFYVDDDAGDD